MAKKSLIVKNDRRAEVVARYAERRRELRALSVSEALTPAERGVARRSLSRLPRDASPVRLRRRDAVDGRPRGHLRKAGVSRVRFRELALHGQLPGITKASW